MSRPAPSRFAPTLGVRARLPDPGCLSPMLATVGAMPTDASAHGYEVKWDGYRVVAIWNGTSLRLCSRNGRDFAPAFPELAALGATLPGPAVLDGELVATDEAGRDDFGALQNRMPGPQKRSRHGAGHRIRYMIFDLLHVGGRSLMGVPFRQRRAALDTLRLAGPAWETPAVHTDGAALLRRAAREGREGLIAKRWDSVYTPGRRSRDWIKIKLRQREEFVIGGYWVEEGRDTLGSLLVGYHLPGRRGLRFAGRVGTGFDQQQRRLLQAGLDRIAVKGNPFIDADAAARGVRWCRPRLVAEVEFAAWTHLGTLRHAAFLGLRADKPAAQVIRPDQRPAID